MPIIDVTCSSRVTGATKTQIAAALPHLVSVAVECDDEPYDGPPQMGDVLIRFHGVGPLDRFDLDVLLEVKSKWFEDRASDRQRRADQIHDGVVSLVPEGHLVGVYLSLPMASWSQTE